MNEPSTSPAGTLDKTDVFKGVRGALITYAAGLGVQILMDLLSYLQGCAQHLPTCTISFGSYDLVVPGLIAAVGFALEMLRRYRADHSNR